MARIRTQLALKRSVRMATEATRNLHLLRSILPPNVIAQLKRGVTLIAQFHENVTILVRDPWDCGVDGSMGMGMGFWVARGMGWDGGAPCSTLDLSGMPLNTRAGCQPLP